MKYFISFLLLFYSLTIYSQDSHENLDEYMNNCQYLKALTYIDEQLPDKNLLFKKALCYKGLDNYKSAVSILRALSEEYPDDKKIRLELARCHIFLSDWDEGLECYDVLIGQDSTNVYYKMQKADILFRKSDYSEALSLYRSMDEDNKLCNILSRSAQCYEEMSMLDSAAMYYQKAWAADSTDAFSAARLINIGLKQKPKNSPETSTAIPQISDAIRYSRIYMERDSTNKQINLLNALGYYILDNWEVAIPRFEKCYAAGDSTLILNRSLGISYYSLGESGQAYPFLKKAYEQDSTNVNVMYCLGTACNDLGYRKEAIRYFTRILERVVPSDAALYSYYRGLATACEGDGQASSAVENYLMAEKYASPKQKIALLYNIASLYNYGLDKPNEALGYYHRYRESMEEYLKELVEGNADKHEIADMEYKLRSLTSHINRLEKQVKKENN